MAYLVIGVAIWAGVHLMPSVAPDLRERLVDMLGPKPYRGAFAGALFLGLILIVIGYRSADWVAVYDPPGWGVHLNNLLMLAAIYLMGVGGAKGWLATKMRHPMLTGVAVWAAAHLLVNGDQASVVLFGAMLLWALAEIFAINRRTGAWAPPAARGARAEIMLVVVTLVIFTVVAFAHGWLLGVYPFPG